MNGERPTSSTYVRPLERRHSALTVLCVTPDEALLSAVAEGLERADPDVESFEARTAAEAFHVLDAEDIGCVVSTFTLEALDGRGFLGQVRAKYEDLPFVLLAENGSESVASEAINAGVDGYVPYEGEPTDAEFETLADRIETVVRDYRSHQRFEDATELLFRLTEYTTDTLWMFTGDWSETVVVNSAYEDVWNRSQANVIEDPTDFLEGIHPDDREGVLEKMQVLSNGEPADIEYRVRTGDGIEWVSVHAEPVVVDGEVEYVAGFTREITERRESREQLQTLVENLPVIVFTLDADGVFTTSAGAGLATLGLEPGELEGLSVYDAYSDYPDLTDAVDRALDGEEVRVTLEVEGVVFETWYRPVRDENGNVTGIVGVSRDVTRLKKREDLIERVNEAARELQHARTEREVGRVVVDIVESVIDCPLTGYWGYDEANDRLDPTTASERALAAADVEDVSGLTPIENGHSEMAVFRAGESRWVENYDDLTDPSSDADLGRLLLVPLGEHGMVNIGHPEPGEFDDFDRYLVEILAQTATVALDRVERERSLESRTTELERSNESLQQFAYVASHDLQEPLRMVSSYVSLLEAEYGDAFDEEGEEYLHYAVDGAQRMQEMIDALLQYSRVQTQGEAFTEVDLESVFEETVRGLGMLVEEEEATVTAGDLPPVHADRSQVAQLLQNLVKNSVDYGGPGATVEVDAVREDDRVRLTVSDDGPGIDESQHDRIFEIFKSNEGGTGIGLAMCKRIAHRHDGDIWVESDPGEGATFHVTFPAVDGVDAETAGTPARSRTETDGGYQ